ncbi:MAG: PASTA domain-containing protein [Actinobacteria bacterium]|nr:PASTA domain-containing protein [Actinomycetota bacterium]
MTSTPVYPACRSTTTCVGERIWLALRTGSIVSIAGGSFAPSLPVMAASRAMNMPTTQTAMMALTMSNEVWGRRTRNGTSPILACRPGFRTARCAPATSGLGSGVAMVQNNPQSSGRIVAGRYRLGPRLGSGVDVAAFEAFDEQLQKVVVLKVVHPDLGDAPQVRREFRATMAIAAGIDHPNVATIIDYGTDQWGPREVLFVVSERFAGGTLRDILDRGRLLAPSQALMVGLDACKGLDAVHRSGLVHADVRPSTLVFGEDRRVRLLDVGLAQLLASAGVGTNAHDNDRVRYASPERAADLPVEAKSDVYSLCLTLIESLSGSVPFESDSAVATLANRVDKLMPVSADLGPLAAVLERAGRPLAADRYTAAEFGRALVQAAEKLPRPAPLPIIGNASFVADPVDTAAADARTRVGESSIAVPDAILPDISAALLLTEASPVLPSSFEERSASRALRADEFGVDGESGVVQVDDRDLDEYPEPPSGRMRKWIVVALVVLAAAGGALAWYLSRPDHVTVPVLAGVEQGIALNQVAGDFSAVAETEPSEDVPSGMVIRTDPGAGASVEKGSALTLFVSSGPAPRVLSELAGLTLAQAQEKLDSIALVLQEGEPVFDETVESGKVVSWTVPDSPTLTAGGTVPKGTTVLVVLSKGPSPLVVPDVSGQSFAAAKASLEAMGFVVTQAEDVFSPAVAAGLVAVQTPLSGTELQKGETITLGLSKGPELVALPSAAGLDYNGIVTALQTLGFGLGQVNGSTKAAFVGYHVNAVAVPAGTLVPKGTVVELFFNAK